MIWVWVPTHLEGERHWHLESVDEDERLFRVAPEMSHYRSPYEYIAHRHDQGIEVHVDDHIIDAWLKRSHESTHNHARDARAPPSPRAD